MICPAWISTRSVEDAEKMRMEVLTWPGVNEVGIIVSTTVIRVSKRYIWYIEDDLITGRGSRIFRLFVLFVESKSPLMVQALESLYQLLLRLMMAKAEKNVTGVGAWSELFDYKCVITFSYKWPILNNIESPQLQCYLLDVIKVSSLLIPLSTLIVSPLISALDFLSSLPDPVIGGLSRGFIFTTRPYANEFHYILREPE